MNTRLTLKKLVSASILAMTLPMANIALAHDKVAQEGKQSAHCERGQYGHKHGFHHESKHHGFKHGNHAGMPHYLHGLALTEAQKDQMFAIRHEQAPAVREQHKQHHALKQALREATHAPAFEDAKVQQIATDLANLERDQMIMHARTQAKLLALLTPEQREKAQAFKQAHGKRTGFKWHSKSHRHSMSEHQKM
jgi:protein CpxP